MQEIAYTREEQARKQVRRLEKKSAYLEAKLEKYRKQ